MQDIQSIRVREDLIDELHGLVLSLPYSIGSKPTNKYELYRVKYADGQIIFYTSGKIVSTSLIAKRVLQKMVIRLGAESTEDVIGSDEVGKGESLGPLVVCATLIPSKMNAKLISKGVMDSKDLSRRRIALVALEIKNDRDITWSKVLVAPERFNKLFNDLKKEKKGLNDLLAWAHTKAIGEIVNKLENSKNVLIIVDEFDRIRTEKRMAKIVKRGFKLEQKVRAEDEVAVACSSILAKDARENWIDEMSKRVKIDLRSLRRSEAIKLPNKGKYFKVDYLKGT